jgi:hypothetical protein
MRRDAIKPVRRCFVAMWSAGGLGTRYFSQHRGRRGHRGQATGLRLAFTRGQATSRAGGEDGWPYSALGLVSVGSATSVLNGLVVWIVRR